MPHATPRVLLDSDWPSRPPVGAPRLPRPGPAGCHGCGLFGDGPPARLISMYVVVPSELPEKPPVNSQPVLTLDHHGLRPTFTRKILSQGLPQ